MTTGRRTRAASLAVAVLALGIGFHSLAGGALPDPTWIAVLTAATLLAAWRWTATAPGVRHWAIATVGGQALVHGFLTATAGHGHADPGIGDPVALALHRIGEDLTIAHLPMALAHTAAALGVGLWLAFGDRVLSLLTSAIAQWWQKVAPQTSVPALRLAVVSPLPRAATPAASIRRTPLTRRGPPAAACA